MAACHVRWDETAQATPHGQLVFFAECLNPSGVLEQRADSWDAVAAQALHPQRGRSPRTAVMCA